MSPEEQLDEARAKEALRIWDEEDGVTDEGHAVIAARLAREAAEARIAELEARIKALEARVLMLQGLLEKAVTRRGFSYDELRAAKAYLLDLAIEARKAASISVQERDQ